VDHLSVTARAGDLILIMSNGGFGGIQAKLAHALKTRSIVPPVPGKSP
jgi:UDP-N-acetylmuramate-alanine ligase